MKLEPHILALGRESPRMLPDRKTELVTVRIPGGGNIYEVPVSLLTYPKHYFAFGGKNNLKIGLFSYFDAIFFK